MPKWIAHIVILAIVVAGVLVWQARPQGSVALEAETPHVLSAEAQNFGMRLVDASESKPEYVRSQMRLCFDRAGSGGCYKTVADMLFRQLGGPEVLNIFRETEGHEEIFSRCHEVTHYIGRLQYTKLGNVPGAYAQSSAVCHGGYYHGVLEQYFKDTQVALDTITDAQMRVEVSTVCRKQSDYESPRVYSECLHGIGHAMMFITEANLPRSLTYCDALADLGSRRTCYGGVFMENSSSSTSLDHPTKYLDPARPEYPCTILDQQYLKTCYEYQSSYFAELAHWDWHKVTQMCAEVPPDYQSGCFHTMGTNQVGYTQDTEIMLANCNNITNVSHRRECVSGIVSAMGGRYVNEPGRMLAFCGTVDSDTREACYSHIGQVVSGWTQGGEERQVVCSTIPAADAAEWCNGR